MRRGLAGTRREARRAIDDGAVTVAGRPTAKASTLVAPDEPIEIASSGDHWASRAGQKLAAALDRFQVPVAGRRALDVGASTGGFTDVLLTMGAASVVAVDVGHGQLLWRLRTDPRVTVVDRTNFRTADPEELGSPFEVITMDVSFISASSLASALRSCGEDGTDYVVLVKPQFEVGRGRVGKAGIVRDSVAHRDAVLAVTTALGEHGVGPLETMPSPVLGAKGNREFLVHARIGSPAADSETLAAGLVP